jgi:hypothetical protein
MLHRDDRRWSSSCRARDCVRRGKILDWKWFRYASTVCKGEQGLERLAEWCCGGAVLEGNLYLPCTGEGWSLCCLNCLSCSATGQLRCNPCNHCRLYKLEFELKQ